MKKIEQTMVKDKIVTGINAAHITKDWQSEGQRIVFTNGCFDLVHRGHVDYLERAALLGDKLVLGLNTDASVQRIKGALRPIVDEQSRAILLAAFQFIDLVVLFDEDTPYDLIRQVQPDILVKGADYDAEDIVGYDVVMARGGKVETLSFVSGFSTSTIIDKIQSEVK